MVRAAVGEDMPESVCKVWTLRRVEGEMSKGVARG